MKHLPLHRIFGNYIRSLRIDQEMTIKEVCKKLKIPRQMLWMWEYERRMPSPQYIPKIMKLFNITKPEQLFYIRPEIQNVSKNK